MALTAVNATSLKTLPAPLETSILPAFPPAYYNGLDALSYRGFAGAFSHPFSGYSPYYGARFGGYDAPIAYGGVPASALPAYSGVPSVYAAPTVDDSALK